YAITNGGSITLTNVTVIDDKLGPVPGSPIPALGTGQSVTLSLTTVISEPTTNIVYVTGYQGNMTCSATGLAVVARAPNPGCDLYPIALSKKSVEGVAVGAVLPDIYNGVQPGNFGWLTWAGSPSEPTLATSLKPPGNSQTYINPLNRNDHVVSIGDWVQGKPGISNSDRVRKDLENLKRIDIVVPVWDRAIGRGNISLY